MATEADELRLTVTLVDNASAGLKSLQQQMQQIGGGQAAANMQNFRRTTEEAHRASIPFFKDLDKVAQSIMPSFARGLTSGAQSLIAFGIGAGTAGAAVAGLVKGITDIKSYSEALRDLGNEAKATGIAAAQIREAQEAFKRGGVADATRDIEGAAKSMADLTRARSVLREEMLKGIMDEGQRAAMERSLVGLSRDDFPTFINDVRKLQETIRQNTYDHLTKLGATTEAAAARAAEAAKRFGEAFQIPDLEKLNEDIRKTSDAENAAWEERIRNGRDFDTLTTSILQSAQHIVENFESIAIPALLPSVREFATWMKSTEESSKDQSGSWDAIARNIKDSVEEAEKFWSFLQKAVDTLNAIVAKEKELADTLREKYLPPPNAPVAPAPPRWIWPPGRKPPGLSGDLGLGDIGKNLGPPGDDAPAGPAGAVPLLSGDRWSRLPMSTHIEDRRSAAARGDTAPLTRATRDLVVEMKRLNDYIQLAMAPEGASAWHQAQIPFGLRHPADRAQVERINRGFEAGGGATPYSLLGGGEGTMSMGGLAPGLGAGPMGGNLARQLGIGDIGAPPGAPAGGSAGSAWHGARHIFGGSKLAAFAPHGSDVGAGAGAGVSGSDVGAGAGAGAGESEPGTSGGTGGGLAAQRAALMKEVDPATKHLLLQMMHTEGGGTATVEALFNRTAMIRQKIPGYSIKNELNSGFYGPIRHGVAQRVAIGAAEEAKSNRTLAQVLGGSDIIQGRTDQGMIGDPNWQGPGRVKAPGSTDIYNYWKGSRRGVPFTYADAQRFAERQEAGRYNLSGSAANVASQKVEGTGKITVDVNAPKGTKVGAQGGGLFKSVQVNRQTQMEKAATSLGEE
jgi:hypothetical protein